MLHSRRGIPIASLLRRQLLGLQVASLEGCCEVGQRLANFGAGHRGSPWGKPWAVGLGGPVLSALLVGFLLGWLLGWVIRQQ